jgi:leucine dehydrogenase
VRQRANEFLAQRGDGLSVDAALERVTAGGGGAPIGLSFGEAA